MSARRVGLQRAFTHAPWLTISVCGAAWLLHAALPSPLVLAYDPRRPLLWQALGCHLVHFSQLHLRWDTLTFALVGAITERTARARQVWFLLAAAWLVPPAACALSPWVTRYAGLSGLVLGQVALLLARSWRRTGDGGWWPAALLAMLYAKQLYELRLGDTSLIAMDYRGFATVPSAHLVSVLLGTLIGALPRRRDAREWPQTDRYRASTS
ncbi:MAG TPA: rhomboid family intramembrane serine protease [Conexibacter sp.]|nr:rhomboid family intramembrane serine protease [Conexibacter sp.]